MNNLEEQLSAKAALEEQLSAEDQERAIDAKNNRSEYIFLLL